MNYVKIIFQQITVEINASAMTLEHANRILSTSIDQVICQVLKLEMGWVEKNIMPFR